MSEDTRLRAFLTPPGRSVTDYPFLWIVGQCMVWLALKVMPWWREEVARENG